MRHVDGSAVRRLLAAAALLVATFVGSTAFAGPALASPSGDLAGATNAARVAAGVRPLAVNAQLNAVAQAWANRLAAAGSLSHNPALRSQVTGWTVLGENVGYAGDVPTVQAAFMASPAHRANILDARFTQLGVGSATSIMASCNCSVLWVVVDFRLPNGAVAPAPPKPAPVKAAPLPPKPAPVQAPVKTAPTRTVPAVAAVGHAAAQVTQLTPVPPARSALSAVASVPDQAPSAAASATALTTRLAASRSPDAAKADPIGRMLTFATVVSKLAA